MWLTFMALTSMSCWGASRSWPGTLVLHCHVHHVSIPRCRSSIFPGRAYTSTHHIVKSDSIRLNLSVWASFNRLTICHPSSHSEDRPCACTAYVSFSPRGLRSQCCCVQISEETHAWKAVTSATLQAARYTIRTQHCIAVMLLCRIWHCPWPWFPKEMCGPVLSRLLIKNELKMCYGATYEMSRMILCTSLILWSLHMQ
jgi:hypothetical protein